MSKIPLVKADDNRLYNLNSVRFFDFENGECHLWFDFNTIVKVSDPLNIEKIKSLVEVS